MNVSELFESKYLKKEDVPSPIVATIANVGTDMLKDQSGQSKKKGIVFFHGGQLKPLILNVGNAKVLTNLYGTDTANWIGKPIEIWVNPNVEMGGEMVGGLRLRVPQNYTPQANLQPPQNGNGSQMNLNMALAALQAVGLTRDDLKRVLISKGFANGYKPERDTQTVHEMIAEAQQNASNGGSDEIPF